MTGLIKNSKNRYHRELLNNSADSPDKFSSGQQLSGSAFFVNGTRTTDKRIIANNLSSYFTNVGGSVTKVKFLFVSRLYLGPGRQN